MKSYIFITEEGVTYQPNSTTSLELEIENCQVIGFAKGENEDDAFKNLTKRNDYLLDTSFNEVLCMELKNEDYYKKAKYFYLGECK